MSITEIVELLASVQGNVTIENGIATLPDGTTIDLIVACNARFLQL